MDERIKATEELLAEDLKQKQDLEDNLKRLRTDLDCANQLARRTERLIVVAEEMKAKAEDRIKRCKSLLYEMRMQKILERREGNVHF